MRISDWSSDVCSSDLPSRNMGTDRPLHGRACLMLKVDIAIIGGGIAGAGLAAMAGAHASIAILEMEDQPGYHTTGRSAAFYAETYGGAAVQPLTTTGRDSCRGRGCPDGLIAGVAIA